MLPYCKRNAWTEESFGRSKLVFALNTPQSCKKTIKEFSREHVCSALMLDIFRPSTGSKNSFTSSPRSEHRRTWLSQLPAVLITQHSKWKLEEGFITVNLKYVWSTTGSSLLPPALYNIYTPDIHVGDMYMKTLTYIDYTAIILPTKAKHECEISPKGYQSLWRMDGGMENHG